MKPGDIILWKASKGDWFGNFLSWLLGRFDKSWRVRIWRPWHAGYCWKVFEDGSFLTVQAVSSGMQPIFYPDEASLGDARVYHWFGRISKRKLDRFTMEYIGTPYDFMAYPGTIFAFICDKLFHYSFYWMDRWLMCWEVVCFMCLIMGKPLIKPWQYPLISRMLKSLESKPVEKKGK